MSPLNVFFLLYEPREQQKWEVFYLQGLLSPELESKSIEPMVLNIKGASGREGRTVQHFIGEGRWKDTPIRVRQRQKFYITLGEDDGVVILESRDFPKQGNAQQSKVIMMGWGGQCLLKDHFRAIHVHVVKMLNLSKLGMDLAVAVATKLVGQQPAS